MKKTTSQIVVKDYNTTLRIDLEESKSQNGMSIMLMKEEGEQRNVSLVNVDKQTALMIARAILNYYRKG